MPRTDVANTVPGVGEPPALRLVGDFDYFWSQGCMMPRYYINDLGGVARVNMLVGLAPSSYGTTPDGLVTDISERGSLGLATTTVIICPYRTTPTPCRTWSTLSDPTMRTSSRPAPQSGCSSGTPDGASACLKMAS